MGVSQNERYPFRGPHSKDRSIWAILGNYHTRVYEELSIINNVLLMASLSPCLGDCKRRPRRATISKRLYGAAWYGDPWCRRRSRRLITILEIVLPFQFLLFCRLLFHCR